MRKAWYQISAFDAATNVRHKDRAYLRATLSVEYLEIFGKSRRTCYSFAGQHLGVELSDPLERVRVLGQLVGAQAHDARKTQREAAPGPSPASFVLEVSLASVRSVKNASSAQL